MSQLVGAEHLLEFGSSLSGIRFGQSFVLSQSFESNDAVVLHERHGRMSELDVLRYRRMRGYLMPFASCLFIICFFRHDVLQFSGQWERIQRL